MELNELEQKVSSLELRISNLEALINASMPEIQHGLVTSAVALGTITKVLIDNKIVTAEAIQEASTKVNEEMLNEYKEWLTKKDEPKTEEKKEDVPAANSSPTA